MTSGSIYFDTDFNFLDGTKGRKLFVVLNDGDCGFYLGVKTTTNPSYKGKNEGCQLGDRYPNFYLPKGSCDLDEDTWIQLDTYFPFSKVDLLKKSFDKVITHKVTLDRTAIIELLDCAINSDDIRADHKLILEEALRKL